MLQSVVKDIVVGYFACVGEAIIVTLGSISFNINYKHEIFFYCKSLWLVDLNNVRTNPLGSFTMCLFSSTFFFLVIVRLIM
jgi:hypothetical protein